MTKSTEERKKELEEKINQLKAQKKKLENREKADERKRRTHRLIQIGAILESSYGTEISPDILAMHLGTKILVEHDREVTIGEVQGMKYRKTAARIVNERASSER